MIAAPSAKLREASPTLASHVYEDMQEESIDSDGGAVGIGIESTIIDMSTDTLDYFKTGIYYKRYVRRSAALKCIIDPAVTDVP